MAEQSVVFSAKGLQPGDRVGPFVLVSKTIKGDKPHRYNLWRLRCCECGRGRNTTSGNLKRYVDWKHCRCVAANAKHGFDGLVEFRIWRGMLNRCYKPTERAYRWYGAIGHYVCKGWRDSFESFLADMGSRPSDKHSIDRIDTLKHYTCGQCDECKAKGDPANCRWATKDVQVRNQKNNLWFTRNGETKILKDWCREVGLTYRVVHRRIYHLGWSFEDAISKPIIRRGRPEAG